MQRRLFVHATNVHQGGGRSLLTALTGALPDGMKSILSLDSRMPLSEDLLHGAQVKYVRRSVLQRLMAERWLAQAVTSQDLVLCFGNLPPLFKLKGRTIVFVQNRYLIDDVPLSGFSLGVKLRLMIERWWLAAKMDHVDEFIVQTPAMKVLMDSRTQGKVPVHVFPFVAESAGYARTMAHSDASGKRDIRFVYVASGEPHKNHRQLIKAWQLLAKEGVFPALVLTLSEANSSELCRWLDQLKIQDGLCVENMGQLPHGQVKQLYQQADALIYPSTFESFGLPLIEARQSGLPVLAAEMDYVRDVLDPEQTFDPESAVSIARAVKRFMGIDEKPLPLQDAAGFMKYILEREK